MTAACLLVRSPACSARQPQTSIVQVVHLCPTGFRKEPCERLERHKPKGLRVVLRGLGSSNAPRLPGGGGGDVTSLPDPGWATTQVYPADRLSTPRLSENAERIVRPLRGRCGPSGAAIVPSYAPGTLGASPTEGVLWAARPLSVKSVGIR